MESEAHEKNGEFIEMPSRIDIDSHHDGVPNKKWLSRRHRERIGVLSRRHCVRIGELLRQPREGIGELSRGHRENIGELSQRRQERMGELSRRYPIGGQRTQCSVRR